MRSRLVAQEINRGHDDDLYAATPPIEASKTLLRIASERRFVEKCIGILFADLSKAHFNADFIREVFIKLPKADPRSSEPHACGKLKLSMYGNRDAAQNWEYEYGGKLIGWGFVKGKSSPCVYYHPHRKIQVYVHGVDFTAVGNRTQLLLFKEELESA